MTIQTRPLGRTGADVTILGYGAMELRGQPRAPTSGVDDLLDGMSRIEFVLRFTLSHPALSSTIVGTSSIDHLRANVAIAEKGPLPADLYEEAKRRLQPALA